MPSAELATQAFLVAVAAGVATMLFNRWLDPLAVASFVALTAMMATVPLVSAGMVLAAVLAVAASRWSRGVVLSCVSLAPLGVLSLVAIRKGTGGQVGEYVQAVFVLGTALAAFGAASLAVDGADDEAGWLVGLLLTISAAGVYAGPPDTEASTLIGAAIGAVVLPAAAVGARRRVGRQPGGVALATFVLAFSALSGSLGRPNSIVGAFGCFGLLIVEPALGVVRSQGQALAWTARGQLARIVIHSAVVVVCSRGAALRADLAVPVLVTLLALGGGALALACLSRDPSLGG